MHAAIHTCDDDISTRISTSQAWATIKIHINQCLESIGGLVHTIIHSTKNRAGSERQRRAFPEAVVAFKIPISRNLTRNPTFQISVSVRNFGQTQGPPFPKTPLQKKTKIQKIKKKSTTQPEEHRRRNQEREQRLENREGRTNK
ncbi:hypothetical protein VNO77_34799 [Canavalia gladiata]|uniref:Uncharacterized protein n=1 Tax=Canavalia gladiata TaxID=3824 RepID=A0AAN9KE19_CANGL